MLDRSIYTLFVIARQAIIQQADSHLKKAKGKSMLPILTKPALLELLDDLPRDDSGRLNFHDIQTKVEKYRHDRIQEYKLVYPSIKGNTLPLRLVKVPMQKTARVSAAVAPPTMFQSMKGSTNSDVIDQAIPPLL